MLIITEPGYPREYSCSLVDPDVTGTVGLSSNEMLRPEAAAQEVDNPAEVFAGHPRIALLRSGRRWPLRQRRRSQWFGTISRGSEERRRDPHGREKPGSTSIDQLKLSLEDVPFQMKCVSCLILDCRMFRIALNIIRTNSTIFEV